jgi:hypothetical protein
MKRSILTIIAIIGLAIPAAASASVLAESFDRDLGRNHVQISTEVRSGQDSFQLYVNRALNGSETLLASFNRDLYRTATPAAPISRSIDSVQQWINVALSGKNSNPLFASFERDLNRTPVQGGNTAELKTDAFQQQFNLALRAGSNPLILSFNRDLYRTATPAAPISRSIDSVQQWINVALTGKSNLLIASYGVDQNAFWWNSKPLTAFV